MTRTHFLAVLALALTGLAAAAVPALAAEILVPGVYVQETAPTRPQAEAKARRSWERKVRREIQATLRKRPGRAKYGDITLKKGYVALDCAPNRGARSKADAWRCAASTDASRKLYIMIEIEQE